MSVPRIVKILALRLVTHIPMTNVLRLRMVKLGGVKIYGKNIYIGEGVIFDSLFPEEIELENMVHVTMGCILLTHNLTDTVHEKRLWSKGHIKIGYGSFIGANSIICNSVNIGKNVIVGAGSVVTKDIPDNEIWGGNPARFIKKREDFGMPW